MKGMKSVKGKELKTSALAKRVLGCAIEVHRQLGPGLLESTYESCLAYELRMASIRFGTQVALPVDYKGIRLDCGYRADILIENEIIIELKSVDALQGVHESQLLTYMKLSGIRQGFLMNLTFNA